MCKVSENLAPDRNKVTRKKKIFFGFAYGLEGASGQALRDNLLYCFGGYRPAKCCVSALTLAGYEANADDWLGGSHERQTDLEARQ